jgi:hypothetical protein
MIKREDVTMPSKADMIRLLEAELDLIEGGGYGRPSGEPGKEKPMFKDSIVCINHWLVPGYGADCDGCLLLDFVPGQHKEAAMPCHVIPLNGQGDTVKSLEARGDQARLEEAVKQWLRATIARLQKELDEELPGATY